MKRLIFFISLIFIFNLATFRLYPVASVDESWQSSNAISVFNKDFVSINYPFFLQNKGIPYAMNFALGLWYKIFGIGLVQGRLLIVFISTILLFILYKFTNDFFGESVAFWAVLYFASTRGFFFSSRFIRNDIPLLIFLILALWMFFKYLKISKPKYLFFSGLFLGLGTEFHQNGIFFIIALIISWVLVIKTLSNIFSRKFLIFITGLGVYLIYYLFAHVLPDTSLYISERGYSIFKDHALPILSLTPKEIIFSEIGRYSSYFYPYRVPELLIVILSLLLSLKEKDLYLKFISTFILSFSVLFVFFASNKTELYLIYLLLLSSILLSSLFHKFRHLSTYIGLILRNKNKQKSLKSIPIIKFFYIFVFITIFNYFLNFGIAYTYSDYSYGKIQSIMSPNIRNDELVMGFTNYFLPLNHLNFRSFYVLSWHRIFKGLSVEQALDEIKPAYIIFDRQVDGMLTDDERDISDIQFDKGLYKISKKEFINYLNSKYTMIIDYHSDYYRNLKLYKRIR